MSGQLKKLYIALYAKDEKIKIISIIDEITKPFRVMDLRDGHIWSAWLYAEFGRLRKLA